MPYNENSSAASCNEDSFSMYLCKLNSSTDIESGSSSTKVLAGNLVDLK